MAKYSSPDDQRLIVKVSKLYYEENLNQDDIVERLHLSRSKVSRILQRARDEGIVQINVISPNGIMSELETRLESRFHLKEAIIIESHATDPQSTITHQLGITAAAYFVRTLQNNDLIGISWGSTLHEMVTVLQPIETKGVQVVQIIGGLGQPEAEVHATDLCRRLSRILSARLTLLPAPGIVDNLRTKEAFLTDTYVQRAMDLFTKLDVAYVGIGSPTPDSLVIKDGSIINNNELSNLLSHHAVGDIALRFFDNFGQPVLNDVDSRVIGINLLQLATIKRVVGVAGGPDKPSAILGALRGGLIDILITDSITAQTVLDLSGYK